MILYLVGISCVGKSTIGKMLSKKIGYSFFDLDEEIQKYYKKPIERIQDECLTMIGFREKGSIVLDQLFSINTDSVISGAPSGLKYSYLKIYKKNKEKKDLISIHINDSFENVLDRLTFFDKDSNPISKKLSDSMRKRYLQEIKADYHFFRDSYNRADIKIDINDTRLADIPKLIINNLQSKFPYFSNPQIF